ncbi:hypothetical protein Smp_134240 [Schistosoma mansoni]|uniref:hypothetical protein n=1 Tax=Schistosoma mansoni TaxID=6183 RepID=UPI0001A64172|nr:hypothetical protein Smp_134240 [Schistosoma mansoni]|eukprot:XP_018649751.1 hypothetical protein Smp_134240 [Schistosoma mansoni]
MAEPISEVTRCDKDGKPSKLDNLLSNDHLLVEDVYIQAPIGSNNNESHILQDYKRSTSEGQEYKLSLLRLSRVHSHDEAYSEGIVSKRLVDANSE